MSVSSSRSCPHVSVLLCILYSCPCLHLYNVVMSLSSSVSCPHVPFLIRVMSSCLYPPMYPVLMSLSSYVSCTHVPVFLCIILSCLCLPLYPVLMSLSSYVSCPHVFILLYILSLSVSCPFCVSKSHLKADTSLLKGCLTWGGQDQQAIRPFTQSTLFQRNGGGLVIESGSSTFTQPLLFQRNRLIVAAPPVHSPNLSYSKEIGSPSRHYHF